MAPGNDGDAGGTWPMPEGRRPGQFQPERNFWQAHNAHLIVPHGPSPEEIRRAFEALGTKEAPVDCLATDRRGLHAAGRGVLSVHHCHLKTRCRPFRRDRWSIGDVEAGTPAHVHDLACDLVQRTRGEVCG